MNLLKLNTGPYICVHTEVLNSDYSLCPSTFCIVGYHTLAMLNHLAFTPAEIESELSEVKLTLSMFNWKYQYNFKEKMGIYLNGFLLYAVCQNTQGIIYE